MNIWITTDLHFNKFQFEFLVKQQDKYDILTINGDLLDSREDFNIQTKWINKTLNSIISLFLFVAVITTLMTR